METQRTAELSSTTRTQKIACPQCGSFQVSTSIRDHEYAYGSDATAVRLPVEIPVHNCVQCNLQFTDSQAEEIKHNALCRHFGVLNPGEVRLLRKKHQMSRSAFGKLSGLGEASLSRWEQGINIQSIAHDRYLRLLSDPTILNRLQNIVFGVSSPEHPLPD